MSTFTPVICSKARMLRPSLPMIRPFISSPGSGTAATTDSVVCSAAMRWMLVTMIARAFASAFCLASVSISRVSCAAWSRASFSTWAISSTRASSAESPATVDSASVCCASASSSRASRRSSPSAIVSRWASRLCNSVR